MNAPALRPCVFFDRDGVVNRSPGPGYVNHLDDFHVLPGFADCVRAAADKGYPAVIVTNQRGISRGVTPPDQLAAMHRHLRAELAREGLALLDILICPADDDAHPDRKPNPGMLRAAAERHGLDLAKSWMVGDRESDVRTGQNAGVAVTVRVDNGSAPTAATYRVPDMPACAALLREKL
ncbi:MAG: D-glycero-alpha-D-manno-heptose-1,7-bisphosphate 7-phosphatase [Kiritimatiellia bacterium]